MYFFLSDLIPIMSPYPKTPLPPQHTHTKFKMPPCTINLAFYLRVMTSHQGCIFGFTAEMTPSILTGILFQKLKFRELEKLYHVNKQVCTNELNYHLFSITDDDLLIICGLFN